MDSIDEAPAFSEEKIKDQIRRRRIERMRLGNRVGTIVVIPSTRDDFSEGIHLGENPSEDTSGVRVGLAPLTEVEYDLCMREVAALNQPDTVAGARVSDRHEKRAVLRRAIRNPNNWDEVIYESVEELSKQLQPEDINFLWDEYFTMSQEFSPTVAALEEEEIDFLKQLFATFPWKDLSGRQLYALNRFLGTLSPGLLTGSSPGSFSINQ